VQKRTRSHSKISLDKAVFKQPTRRKEPRLSRHFKYLNGPATSSESVVSVPGSESSAFSSGSLLGSAVIGSSSSLSLSHILTDRADADEDIANMESLSPKLQCLVDLGTKYYERMLLTEWMFPNDTLSAEFIRRAWALAEEVTQIHAPMPDFVKPTVGHLVIPYILIIFTNIELRSSSVLANGSRNGWQKFAPQLLRCSTWKVMKTPGRQPKVSQSMQVSPLGQLYSLQTERST
jgi:hypothetical protein